MRYLNLCRYKAENKGKKMEETYWEGRNRCKDRDAYSYPKNKTNQLRLCGVGDWL